MLIINFSRLTMIKNDKSIINDSYLEAEFKVVSANFYYSLSLISKFVKLMKKFS
jgi:hypothetical protein